MSACACGRDHGPEESLQVLLADDGASVLVKFAGVTAELGWRDSLRMAEAFKHAGDAICGIREVADSVRDRVMMEACAAAGRTTDALVAEILSAGGRGVDA